MRKIVFSLLFFSSPLSAMNNDFDDDAYFKNSFVRNAQTAREEADRKMEESKKVAELMHLCDQWKKADKIAHTYVANLDYIRGVVCQMKAWVEEDTKVVDLPTVDIHYQDSLLRVTNVANDMPALIFSVMSLRGDQAAGNLVFNAISSSILQLNGTNVLTFDNRENAKDILQSVMENLDREYQGQANNRRTIDLELSRVSRLIDNQFEVLFQISRQMNLNEKELKFLLTKNRW